MAGLLEAAVWTPEDGGLSAEDGLGALSRFSRSCAAVSERVRSPNASTPIIVGTVRGCTEPPLVVHDELQGRWPGARISIVMGHAETIGVSFLEASIALQDASQVLWTIVELQPGAELVAAFLLCREGGSSVTLERCAEPKCAPVPHLNPCAPVLGLKRREEAISIRAGSWVLTLAPNG